MHEIHDPLRILNEWALVAGRKLQSQQTGYLHLCYGESLEGAQTIPLIENTLFALALLKSRLVEQVQEAKIVLKGVLAFQNLLNHDDHGNFPLYLHHYPTCHDPSISLQLLAPFYWIISQFSHILGADLKKQIERAAHLALEYSLRKNQTEPFPYSMAIRLAAAQYCFGLLWNKQEWQIAGWNELEQLTPRQLTGWYQTKHLGDLLVGLQMAYPSIKNSSWQPLWERMEQTWHSPTSLYIGPCIKEWQQGVEPLSNLYDLFGGYFDGKFSQRLSHLQPLHLYTSLIRPTQDRFRTPLQTSLQSQDWKIISYPEGAYTLRRGEKAPHMKHFTPFRMIWGDLDRAHTFVCQGGEYRTIDWSHEGNICSLTFDLVESSEDRSAHHPIEFYFDAHPEILFKVNDTPSNTFEINQRMKVELGKHPLFLTFSIVEGDGHFLGHVMKCNRPTQIDQNRLKAYDWTLFLRTIRRSSRCQLKVTLEVPFA